MKGDKMCGLCMEFGPNGALQVPFNQEISETCDVNCENGEPNCKFLVNDVNDEEEDRFWRRRCWRLKLRFGRWRLSLGRCWLGLQFCLWFDDEQEDFKIKYVLCMKFFSPSSTYAMLLKIPRQEKALQKVKIRRNMCVLIKVLLLQTAI